MPTYDANTLFQWPLEQDPTGGAGAILDASGNARHGTANNMEAGDLVAGKINNCLAFDGTNEYVSLAAATAINSLSTFTLSFWAKQTARTDLKVIQSKGLYDFIRSNTSGFGVTGLRFAVGFGTNGATSADAITTTISTLTSWHWYACAIGSDKVPHIYIDGVEASYGTQTTGSGTRTNNNANAMFIGADGFGGAGWNGLLDEVQLDNVARDATWAAATYAAMTSSAKPWVYAANRSRRMIGSGSA